MDINLIKCLENKKDISRHDFQHIKEVGFLTGSYVFGDGKYDDIDILVKHSDVVKKINFSHMVEQSDYQNTKVEGYYFKYEDQVYNLLVCYDDELFNIWKEATETFIYINKRTRKKKAMQEIRKDKLLRVEFFRLLKRGLGENE